MSPMQLVRELRKLADQHRQQAKNNPWLERRLKAEGKAEAYSSAANQLEKVLKRKLKRSQP